MTIVNQVSKCLAERVNKQLIFNENVNKQLYSAFFQKLSFATVCQVFGPYRQIGVVKELEKKKTSGKITL